MTGRLTSFEDACQYVGRRVKEGVAFSFRQWGTDMELRVLAELQAVAIDYVASTPDKRQRQVIKIGEKLWLQEGDENTFRWEPIPESWMRFLTPPRHMASFRLMEGELGRLVFEQDGRFLWLAESRCYTGRKGDWNKLEGEQVIWQEGEVTPEMEQSVRETMVLPLPPESALKRMTKTEILQYSIELNGHPAARFEFQLSLEQTKDEMIQTLKGGQDG